MLNKTIKHFIIETGITSIKFFLTYFGEFYIDFKDIKEKHRYGSSSGVRLLKTQWLK